MENKVEIQKPIILEMDEVKVEIVDVVNRALQVHKLPFYLLDMILSELCVQIKEGARNELEAAKKQMAQQNEPTSEEE